MMCCIARSSRKGERAVHLPPTRETLYRGRRPGDRVIASFRLGSPTVTVRRFEPDLRPADGESGGGGKWAGMAVRGVIGLVTWAQTKLWAHASASDSIRTRWAPSPSDPRDTGPCHGCQRAPGRTP